MLTEHRVGPVEPTVAGGHGIAPQLLARRCGAVIAYNDLVAIGVMRGLAELGARVPQDVSVVGFDNGSAPTSCIPRCRRWLPRCSRWGRLPCATSCI